MKILELNFEKTWRGGERQTLYCMRGFKSAGCDVSVLCRKGYPMQEKAEAEGFKTYAFDSVFKIVRFLISKGADFDILHVETAGVLTYCVLTKPFHRTKIVYTRRVDFVPNGFLTWLKYRLTDKLVAISTAIQHIIKDFSQRNAVLISDIVVEQKLDRGRATDAIKEFGVQSGKKIVGTIAAFVPHKDPLTMVETIRHLSDIRSDFQFVHFGAGELENVVRSKIEEYGLQNVYLIPGFQENVEDFFSVFDVFVMSSEEEGLGSSVLDAFLYKVPVVATDAGGLTDLLKDGRGIQCGVKQPKDIAEAVDRILSNTELRSNVIQKSEKYVMQYHDIEYITDRYMKLFRGVLRN